MLLSSALLARKFATRNPEPPAFLAFSDYCTSRPDVSANRICSNVRFREFAARSQECRAANSSRSRPSFLHREEVPVYIRTRNSAPANRFIRYRDRLSIRDSKSAVQRSSDAGLLITLLTLSLSISGRLFRLPPSYDKSSDYYA